MCVLRTFPSMDNSYSLGAINLGLGGLGDALNQQVQDDEDERKKKLVNLGLNRGNGNVNAAGLKAISILGNLGG